MELPNNAYRIVAPQPTRGLFPAGIGVTRLAFVDAEQSGDGGADAKSSDSDVGPDDSMVAPVDTDSGRDNRLEGATDAPPAEYSATELRLLADPCNEFLQWNSAFDDQLAVSEVFPIVQRDLGGGEARPEQVLAAVYALGGRLGLIYAVNEIGEDQTEIIGVLYESAGYRPLAAIHASAVTIVPPDADRPFRQEDIWQTDSRALARERFRRLVHMCVHELIVNDLPAEVEAPEGWVPAGPLLPAEWPPPPRRR